MVASDAGAVDDAGRVVQLQHEVAQLKEAMATQRQIGTVVGLLAGRLDCTTDQAWLLLVRLSQSTNTKVQVATRVLLDAFNGRPCPEDGRLLAALCERLPTSGSAAPGTDRDG